MDVRIEGEVENLPIFRGPELDPASVKELKKIQIEIRRNLPEKSGRSRSPIRRNISDPENLFVPRKPGGSLNLLTLPDHFERTMYMCKKALKTLY